MKWPSLSSSHHLGGSGSAGAGSGPGSVQKASSPSSGQPQDDSLPPPPPSSFSSSSSSTDRQPPPSAMQSSLLDLFVNTPSLGTDPNNISPSQLQDFLNLPKDLTALLHPAFIGLHDPNPSSSSLTRETLAKAIPCFLGYPPQDPSRSTWHHLSASPRTTTPTTTTLARTDLETVLSALARFTAGNLDRTTAAATREDLSPASLRIRGLAGVMWRNSKGDPRRLTQWTDDHLPNLWTPLTSHIAKRVDVANGVVEWTPPTLSTQSDVLSDALVWIIDSLLPIPQSSGCWDVLYSSRRHGQSLTQFETHTLKYPAPTLLLVSGSPAGGTTMTTLAAYLPCPWRKTRGFWGSDG
ncbi:hypothetical protein HKX48_002721, partial [Thoreauomyces humboldtii]